MYTALRWYSTALQLSGWPIPVSSGPCTITSVMNYSASDILVRRVCIYLVCIFWLQNSAVIMTDGISISARFSVLRRCSPDSTWPVQGRCGSRGVLSAAQLVHFKCLRALAELSSVLLLSRSLKLKQLTSPTLGSSVIVTQCPCELVVRWRVWSKDIISQFNQIPARLSTKIVTRKMMVTMMRMTAEMKVSLNPTVQLPPASAPTVYVFLS